MSVRHVYKYQIPVADGPTALVMPAGATIVTVGLQHDKVCLWAESEEMHKPSGLMEDRRFITYDTGHDIPDPSATYVGTVFDHEFVWHIYEIPPFPPTGETP